MIYDIYCLEMLLGALRMVWAGLTASDVCDGFIYGFEIRDIK